MEPSRTPAQPAEVEAMRIRLGEEGRELDELSPEERDALLDSIRRDRAELEKEALAALEKHFRRRMGQTRRLMLVLFGALALYAIAKMIGWV